jgi:hypothetical protein
MKWTDKPKEFETRILKTRGCGSKFYKAEIIALGVWVRVY